jgi:hypothetical protein
MFSFNSVNRAKKNVWARWRCDFACGFIASGEGLDITNQHNSSFVYHICRCSRRCGRELPDHGTHTFWPILLIKAI